MATIQFKITDSITCDYNDVTNKALLYGSGAMPNYSQYGPFKQKSLDVVEVEISYGITSIGDRFCKECSNLKSVIINGAVNSIGISAFESCISLTEINLYMYTEYIGVSAFQDCRALRSVIIPSSVRTLNAKTFYKCASLNSITLHNNITNIGEFCFSNCELESITLPEYIETIGQHAFAGSNLKSITIPNSLVTLSPHTFYRCQELTSVVFSNRLTTIGKYAFGECTKLLNISLPSSLKKIETDAFHSSGLNHITLPNRALTIERHAFAWCNSLKTVTNLATKNQDIASDAFYKSGDLYYEKIVYCYLINYKFVIAAELAGFDVVFLDSDSVVYEIWTPQDLYNIRYALNKKYRQMADIDLSGYSNWEPIGDINEPFTGSYDGNGFTLYNLNINRPTKEYVGLFGNVLISNNEGVHIRNCTLHNANVIGKSRCGTLIGRMSAVGTNSYDGSIYNCHATGRIVGTSIVGGIIGSTGFLWCEITNCSYDGTAQGSKGGKGVTGMIGGLIGAGGSVGAPIIIKHCSANVQVSGGSEIGGLAGALMNGEIRECFSIGDVTFIQDENKSPEDEGYVGGLVGYANLYIYDSFFIGNVNGPNNASYVGGFCGVILNAFNCYCVAVVAGNMASAFAKEPYPIYSCYYNGDTTDKSDEKAFLKSTNQMKQQQTFENWNFDNIWMLTPSVNEGYPFLIALYHSNSRVIAITDTGFKPAQKIFIITDTGLKEIKKLNIITDTGLK